jgi:hypothetical protein
MKNFKPLLIIAIIIIVILGVWYFLAVNNSDENLNDEQFNCIESGGAWIDDECVFPDEASVSEFKLSCEEYDGEWLGDSYECVINDEAYRNGEWESIDWNLYEAYKESCLEFGGDYIGGSEMACDIDGNVYKDGYWKLDWRS